MHPLDALLKEGVRNSLPNALEVSYPFDVPFRNTIKKAQHPYITLKTNQVIKMQLMEVPLASPLPTTAPHPRDVARKLLQARQGALATCGWVDGDFCKVTLSPNHQLHFVNRPDYFSKPHYLRRHRCLRPQHHL